MNKSKMKQFAGQLEKERERILGKLRRTISEVATNQDGGNDDVDEANAELALSQSLRHRKRDNKLLAKIEVALERIGAGEYGFCEECGGPIGLKRLNIKPFARLCIECQEVREKRGKQFASNGSSHGGGFSDIEDNGRRTDENPES